MRPANPTPPSLDVPAASVRWSLLFWVAVPAAAIGAADAFLALTVAPDTLDAFLITSTAAAMILQLCLTTSILVVLWAIVEFACSLTESRARVTRASATFFSAGLVIVVGGAASVSFHRTLIPLQVLGLAAIGGLCFLRAKFHWPNGPRTTSALVFGVSLILACMIILFGTSAHPLTPKYLRDTITLLVAMAVAFQFALFTTMPRRSSLRRARIALLCGLLATVVISTSLAILPERTRFLVARTLEGTRGLRNLNREFLASIGGRKLPWMRDFIGDQKTPAPSRLVEGPVPECKQVRPALARSVLLITVDALRSDYYGVSLRDLPNLYRLNRTARVFSRAIQTASGTDLSLFSMHTGRYPVFPARSGDLWGTLEKKGGFERTVLRQDYFSVESSREFTERVTEHLVRHASRNSRFLLHAHYLTLHLPRGLSRRHWDYEERLRIVDRELGALLATVDRLALRESTLLIVTADHGEELRHERGYVSHGYGVVQSVIHTPMLVASPGVEPSHIDNTVSGVDVLPTTLDALGVECDFPIHGRSLLRSPQKDRLVYSSSIAPTPVSTSNRPLIYSDIHTVLRWPWKLTFNRAERAWALHRLDEDPNENVNLIDDPPPIASLLRERLLSYLAGREPTPD